MTEWLRTDSLWIPGPLPAMNEIESARGKIYRGKGGKRVGSAYNSLKRQWEAKITAIIRHQKMSPFDVPVEIKFLWIEKNRRRDKDNIRAGAKFILDALVLAEIIPNDNWKWVVNLFDEYMVDSAKPGVHVTITAAREEEVE